MFINKIKDKYAKASTITKSNKSLVFGKNIPEMEARAIDGYWRKTV
jgi:hypothetical protein